MPTFKDMKRIHDEVEKDVEDFLAQRAIHTEPGFTYHEHMQSDVVKAMMSMNDETSIYVRTRQDKLAVHVPSRRTFLLEVKGAMPGAPPNALVEAFPLAIHHLVAKMGVKTLYCYRNSKGVDRGWWADNIPESAWLVIPERHKHLAPVLMGAIDRKARSVDRVNGSNDPYVEIVEGYLNNLPSWQSLIDEWLGE